MHTQANLKEHCKFILTWSGKEVGKGIGDNIGKEKAMTEKQEGENEEGEREVEPKIKRKN